MALGQLPLRGQAKAQAQAQAQRCGYADIVIHIALQKKLARPRTFMVID